MLKELPDELIVDSYYKAIDFNLEEDFILILEEEINERGLKVKSVNSVL